MREIDELLELRKAEVREACGPGGKAMEMFISSRTTTTHCQKHGDTPGPNCAACYAEEHPNPMTLKLWELESRILALEVKG